MCFKDNPSSGQVLRFIELLGLTLEEATNEEASGMPKSVEKQQLFPSSGMERFGISKFGIALTSPILKCPA